MMKKILVNPLLWFIVLISIPAVGAIDYLRTDGTNTMSGKLGITATSTEAVLDIRPYRSTATGAYKTFGDSITAGHNATNVGVNDYVSLVATTKGWTATNLAVDGNNTGHLGEPVTATAVPYDSNEVYSFMIGTNDQRTSGVDANIQANFKTNTQAWMAWLAIPDIQKKLSDSTDCIASGTWFPFAAFTTINNFYSSSVGDYVECTVSGTTVYIGYFLGTVTNDSTVAITVDGQAAGTIDTSNGSVIPGAAYSMGLFRHAGLTVGKHVVRFTIATSSGGAGNAGGLFYMAGNGWVGGIQSPHVYVLNIIPQATGYAFGGSEANVHAYNTDLLTNVTQLIMDRLNVHYVDVHAGFNAATMLDDGLHPNNLGHTNIANTLSTAIGNLTTMHHYSTVFDDNGSIIVKYLVGATGTVGRPCNRTSRNFCYWRLVSGIGSAHCCCLPNASDVPTWSVDHVEGTFLPAACP